MSQMTELLRHAMQRRNPPAKRKSTGRRGRILDDADALPDDPALADSADADADAADHTVDDIGLSAVAAVQQWAETDDLGEGETCADRLQALMVGIADPNKDGDITPDDQSVLQVALNAAWDYLVKLGVTDDDAGALLNDWDDETAERVRDLVAQALPEGDDAAADDMDDFVFTDDDDAPPALDSAGARGRIRKRIAGRVRLSAAQKVACRKARGKSHSSHAMARRMK
jgi:hypothetical protein